MRGSFSIVSMVCGVMLLSTPLLAQTWNSPHAPAGTAKVRYGAFVSPPKTLDPAKSYSSNEIQFIAQIYEPPLQYHYWKRPYALESLTAVEMPKISYVGFNGKKLTPPIKAKQVAYTLYDISIKPGIVYAPHPALAKQGKRYRYHQLNSDQLQKINVLSDLAHTGSRELTAQDYVNQIKRLAHPALHSPILGLMSEHIMGLKEYSQRLQAVYHQLAKHTEEPYLDLRDHPIDGVKAIGRYRYQIKIKGLYPQFKYWLAMPFFAPVPWEADRFYSQAGLREKNITLDVYPVGTGPYLLSKHNPNRQIVLSKNPSFRSEHFPTGASAMDQAQGYAKDIGQRLPMVDRFVFDLDKESIPRWNKFLQGYYDKSGIGADSFDQAIQLDVEGKPLLTPEMQQQGIQLQTTVSPAVYYIGFNMLDDIVGGHSQRAKWLRQAIAIAVDYEEYISIFMNGRGKSAQGPVPPGIFGYREGQAGINDMVYEWDGQRPSRRPLSYAKALLAKAGYPGGRDAKTGKQLILHYDVASGGSPDDKARLNWMRKQFAKIDIELNIRATHYNRFRDKVRKGNMQLFSWGWLADYPDPENFLFLLYGPNGKVKHGGENAANYDNPRVNQLFEQIKHLPNGPQRLGRVDELLKIVREDTPWIWGVHPIDFTLSHQWNRPSKAHAMANNTLKYERINAQRRSVKLSEWNQPILWPLLALIAALILLIGPLVYMYQRRQRRPAITRYKEGS